MKSLGIAVALVAALSASAVYADPIDTTILNLTELQGVFDDINSTIDAVNDATGDELFAFQTRVSSATYIATASFTGNLEFGLYDVYDRTNQVTLFETASPTNSTPGDASAIILDITGTSVNVINTNTFTIMDSATFATRTFGFWVATPDHSSQPVYYSESKYNPVENGESDHFLTYAGQNDLSNPIDFPGVISDINHWYVAAEAWDLDPLSLADYTDMVVLFESIEPVPEPGTLALVGVALVGAAVISRRRRNKA